jgi:molybdenum-dependent DNA-binding transcriptional regulator ModE
MSRMKKLRRGVMKGAKHREGEPVVDARGRGKAQGHASVTLNTVVRLLRLITVQKYNRYALVISTFFPIYAMNIIHL